MKITARCPIQQYGYMEFEGTQADLTTIERYYNMYAEKPLTFRGAPEIASSDTHQWKVIETFTGEKLRYDSEKHHYETLDGKRLLSGSKYAEQFATPFDRDLILGRTAKKLGSTVEHIGKLWDKRGEMARHFGTALHVAMETWFLGRGTGYEIPKIQFLADAVDSFPLKNEKVLPEIMVSDVKRLLVGQIDGLLVTGEKQGVILDYKTDQSIKKNLPKHEAQMSLYASILKAFGWSISHAELWSYTSKWEKFHVDLKEVKI